MSAFRVNDTVVMENTEKGNTVPSVTCYVVKSAEGENETVHGHRLKKITETVRPPPSLSAVMATAASGDWGDDLDMNDAALEELNEVKNTVQRASFRHLTRSTQNVLVNSSSTVHAQSKRSKAKQSSDIRLFTSHHTQEQPQCVT